MDARTTPLVFEVVAEAGDPATTNLRITPHLDGVVRLWPGGAGHVTTTTATLQLFMSVDVDQQQVSRDSLVADLSSSNGVSQNVSVTFPKGAANIATVPVSAGAEVTIRLWGYVRTYSAGNGSYAFGETPQGQGRGPAIVVDAQDVGTTDVPGETARAALRVGARPNPASGPMRLSYSMPRAADVRLAVYDLAGARVATLVQRFEGAGSREIVWDGRDSGGHHVGPGVYLVELTAGGERARGRLVVIGR